MSQILFLGKGTYCYLEKKNSKQTVWRKRFSSNEMIH